ncbi:MAG TPA: hypothetical protein VJV05_11525 [Pyrinomonadaceae bacterium]|nr:hypothetical protein [Pyrinomonadaceae bacterium]
MKTEPKSSPTVTSPADSRTQVPVAADKTSDNQTTTDNPATTPSTTPYVRPSADKRFKKYIGSMFGPWSIGRAVASAGLSTWSNSPEEWGEHWDGFGKRFASNMGRSVMKNTMMYGMDEAFKLDSYYYRSTKRDWKSKAKNAMLSPVIARKPDGRKVFGFPRVVSTYASSVIVSETWYPGTDWKDGLRNGSFTLLFNGGYNLLKEFVWKK